MTDTKASQVKSRPGRIQTLAPEQEVVLKQTWAYLLKYWGYPIAINAEDLAFRECFIPSTMSSDQALIASTLNRTSTRNSTNSNSTCMTGSTSTKKKGGFFSSKRKSSAPATPPANSKRMREIQTQSSLNNYEPITTASDTIRSIFLHLYKEGFQHSKHFAVVESSDTASIDSFVTAFSSFADNDTASTLVSKSNLNIGISKSKTHSSSFKPNTSIIPKLSKYKPIELHNSLFAATRIDLLDSFVLRFVKARNLVAENAVAMLVNSLHWRHNQFPVDDWVLEGDAKSYLTGTNEGFIQNLAAEKSGLRGTDVNGIPIFYFKSRKNFSSNYPFADNQRFCIFSIESIRLCLNEVAQNIDQTTIVFDLTGFGLRNADNATIKFLAEAMEAHYPETLRAIYIHNAPWIFSQIWNVIKNWLDPVVASKIHFTKNVLELSRFIDPKYIPKEVGGQDDFEVVYPQPSKADVYPPKKKDATFVKLMSEREELFAVFIDLTIRWIEATNPEVSAKYLKDKIDIGAKLIENYIAIDPYIRCRSLFDRNGCTDFSI